MTLRRCSECRAPVRQPKTGRARATCGPRCARARDARRKREARAAENPVEVAHLKELRHWARTGDEWGWQGLAKDRPPGWKEELVRVWLHHTCKACRR